MCYMCFTELSGLHAPTAGLLSSSQFGVCCKAQTKTNTTHSSRAEPTHSNLISCPHLPTVEQSRLITSCSFCSLLRQGTQQKAPSSSWGPPKTLSVRGSLGLQGGLDQCRISPGTDASFLKAVMHFPCRWADFCPAGWAGPPLPAPLCPSITSSWKPHYPNRVPGCTPSSSTLGYRFHNVEVKVWRKELAYFASAWLESSCFRCWDKSFFSRESLIQARARPTSVFISLMFWTCLKWVGKKINRWIIKILHASNGNIQCNDAAGELENVFWHDFWRDPQQGPPEPCTVAMRSMRSLAAPGWHEDRGQHFPGMAAHRSCSVFAWPRWGGAKLLMPAVPEADVLMDTANTLKKQAPCETQLYLSCHLKVLTWTEGRGQTHVLRVSPNHRGSEGSNKPLEGSSSNGTSEERRTAEAKTATGSCKQYQFLGI